VSWEDGRNDRDSVPGLSKGQQCAWRATFKGNVRPEVGHATDRIKCEKQLPNCAFSPGPGAESIKSRFLLVIERGIEFHQRRLHLI
jgi:hypothetical protein